MQVDFIKGPGRRLATRPVSGGVSSILLAIGGGEPRIPGSLLDLWARGPLFQVYLKDDREIQARASTEPSVTSASLPPLVRVLLRPRLARILELVWSEERSAGAIASHFPVTFGAISQQLAALRQAGLVRVRKDGRRRLYRARREVLGDALPLLQALWRLPPGARTQGRREAASAPPRHAPAGGLGWPESTHAARAKGAGELVDGRAPGTFNGPRTWRRFP